MYVLLHWLLLLWGEAPFRSLAPDPSPAHTAIKLLDIFAPSDLVAGMHLYCGRPLPYYVVLCYRSQACCPQRTVAENESVRKSLRIQRVLDF